MARTIEVPLLFVGLYTTTLISDWRYCGIVPAPNDRLELWAWRFTPHPEFPGHKTYLSAPKSSAEFLGTDGIRFGNDPNHMFVAEPDNGPMTFAWNDRWIELTRQCAQNFVVAMDPNKGHDLYRGAPRDLCANAA